MKKWLAFLMAALMLLPGWQALGEGEIEWPEPAQGWTEPAEPALDLPLALESEEPEPAQASGNALAARGVEISMENFPSNDFRNYIRSQYDADGDRLLSGEEIAAATQMDLGYLYIDDLRGLSLFTSLRTLKCNGVEGLEALDLSGMESLTEVEATYNQITRLDASGCTGLKRLNCAWNQLESLKLSGCGKLTALDCSGNRLAKLDLSDAVGLKTLSCSRSEVKALKLPEKAKLTDVDCSSNFLEKLDLSGCPKLKELNCCNNRLTALDLRKLKRLTAVKCDGNQLAKGGLKLPTSSALKTLSCRNNPMTALDVSGQGALKTLDCLGSGVKSLRLNLGLTALYCGETKLERLDLSAQEALKCLDCTDAPVSSLTLGRKPSLQRLFISGCKLKKVDVSGCSDWIRAVLESHVYERSGGSWISWRQGKKRGLVADARTRFTDGSRTLYKPGKVKGVAFGSGELTLKAGEKAALRLELNPGWAATACKFSVSDKSVVRVSRSADAASLYSIRAMNPGTATITVRVESGKSAVLHVTVN